MTFYDEWIAVKNTDSEIQYIERFLCSDKETTGVFHGGSQAELGTAISVMTSVSIEKYIEIVDHLTFVEKVSSDQVPQFSEFDDAIYRLPELLEFAPGGLSFENIGYQLVKSPTEGARIKYGENHSKLAAMMDLVEIRKRPSNVISTALGKYLIAFLPAEKKELLKRLVLRQYIIKKMIHESKEEFLCYRDIVSELSLATAIRRRNNVKILLEFVLAGTDEEVRLSRIDWQVKE